MKRKIMKLIITIMLAACSAFCGAADDALVSTMGKGVGATAEDALKDSFRDAVERAVGVFVDAEQQAENDQLIRDQVLTHSNAYIENYRIVSQGKGENGLMTVKIVAKVKKGELTRKLRDAMPEKTFSLGDELKRRYGERQKQKVELAKQEEVAKEQERQTVAKEQSKEKRDADAAALIKNTLADFNPSAMMFDVAATGTKPTVSEKDGDVTVGFDMSLRLSTEKYFNTLAPRLKQLFGQISLKPPKTVSFILKRQDVWKTLPCAAKVFWKCTKNITVQPTPRGALFAGEIEIGGTECMLPCCDFEKEYRLRDSLVEPSMWIVDKITGTGDRKRVTMIGYFLSKACLEALRQIVDKWAQLPPVKFVAELVDESDGVVTAQKFLVAQDCGWIGWGKGLKPEQTYRPFYVMPWIMTETKMTETNRFRKSHGFWFDEQGNCLGANFNHNHKNMAALVEEVPFRCEFKVLEDELKSVSSIRVRMAE